MPGDSVRSVSDREAIEATFRPAVLVAPASPRTFDHDDFSDLVYEVIRETDLMADQVEIRLGYLYGDVWPPGWTWVNFVLEGAAEEAIGGVAAAITIWGRKWIKKARQRGAEADPIKAIIYNSRGEVLREVEVVPEDPKGPVVT